MMNERTPFRFLHIVMCRVFVDKNISRQEFAGRYFDLGKIMITSSTLLLCVFVFEIVSANVLLQVRSSPVIPNRDAVAH